MTTHRNHETMLPEHDTTRTPSTPGKSVDPDAPTAIPPGYVPEPYPGWRWNEAGDDKLVNNKTEDEAASAEGYTLAAPPQPPPTVATPKTPPTHKGTEA